MNELKAYTKEEIAEQQRLYDEVFTPVWESEGQYCRAGGGQHEKSFAWWAFKHQQTKVDELQFRIETSLDEIRRALNCVESTETECVLRELEQALKGGSDE